MKMGYILNITEMKICNGVDVFSIYNGVTKLTNFVTELTVTELIFL